MVRLQKFPNLSIIIPTLNEASHLPLLFADLNECPYDFDLIIVDADEGSDICSFLKVKGYPCLVSFINKEMVESVLGADVGGINHFFNETFKRVLN